MWWVATAWAGGVLVAGVDPGVTLDGVAVPAFAVVAPSGRIDVPADAHVDLVWLDDGRRERWVGPARVRLGAHGGHGRATPTVGSVGPLAIELASLPRLVASAPGWRPIDDRQRAKALAFAPPGLTEAEGLAWTALYEDARRAGGPDDPVPDVWLGVVQIERDPTAAIDAFDRAIARCGAAGCPSLVVLRDHAKRRVFCAAQPVAPECWTE